MQPYFSSYHLALRLINMASVSARAILCWGFLAGGVYACASGKGPSPGTAPPPSNPNRGTIVTSDELDRTPQIPIETFLAARVPGLIVTRTADGGLALRIRGQISVMGGTEPLYVIDDMPIKAGPGGVLQGINPRDIASIEVLKDAASTAFYGLRGANGVILIKTKHGSQ